MNIAPNALNIGADAPSAAPGHDRPSHCPNCGTAIGGDFCAGCGQRSVLHGASAREFLHEFVGHYVALEGKLWGTLSRLLFRPGALTNEYIAGRRVRYVEPLRVYLTFSILFFALFKLPALALIHVNPGDQMSVSSMVAQAAESDPEAGKARLAIDTQLPWLAPRLKQVQSLSVAEAGTLAAEGFVHYAPYAMFCLLPVFALYLKLLYLGSGRRYGEHFLFALHSNAFAFLMFGLIIVTPFQALQGLLLGWMLLYLPWAMRRVYRRSWGGTLARWVALIFVHVLSITLVMLAVMAWSVLK